MVDGFPLDRLEAAAARVHGVLSPTPQYCWPLLSARAGAEIWVKHENHLPVGAFKVRGGVFHIANLKAARPDLPGVIAATRGNHGQSLAFAAQRCGIACVVVVPHGNSVEKNAAMRAQGAELIEHGHDFQAALEFTQSLAVERRLHMIGPFVDELVLGVASYSLEFLRAAPALDTVYVPIGMGSGICGMIAVRDALGLATRIVGVVAENAPAYALSFAAGKPVSTNRADTLADGLACRVPSAQALAIILKGAERVVTVTDDEIRAAMRAYFSDTHNLAEPAGAAPLAGALQERARNQGKRIGVILSGGNVDRAVFAPILAEGLQ
jgi:threonine dehydratase